MANNIVIGQNVVFARETTTILSTGINSGNTVIIYLITPTVFFSFVPGRPINAFNTFETGKSYFINSKQTMDLTEYLSPPFDELQWAGNEW